VAFLFYPNAKCSHQPDLNVLAQTFAHMPIHVHIGNFDVTSEYANALKAWFGLFLVVFGMKLPQV